MSRPVQVLLFATAREAVGRSRLTITVGPEGRPVEAVLADLVTTYPKLKRVLPQSRVVLNGTAAAATGPVVRPGDEVAIHPPYSGG